jgi:AcrR family transcriptional regulator
MNTNVREKRRTITLEEIHAAAWKQIGELGAASLSLRGIGRELGMSAPGLYYYYKDRDALVTALLMESFTAFGDALEAGRDSCPAGDYAGRIRAICKAYFNWAAQNPQRYALMFDAPIQGYLFAKELGPAAQRSFVILQRVMGEAQAAGKITGPWAAVRLPAGLKLQLEALKKTGIPFTPFASHLALAVWSTLHGMTSLYLHQFLSGFLQQQVDAFVDFEIEKINRMLGLV